jgi:hypothetical protein
MFIEFLLDDPVTFFFDHQFIVIRSSIGTSLILRSEKHSSLSLIVALTVNELMEAWWWAKRTSKISQNIDTFNNELTIRQKVRKYKVIPSSFQEGTNGCNQVGN